MNKIIKWHLVHDMELIEPDKPSGSSGEKDKMWHPKTVLKWLEELYRFSLQPLLTSLLSVPGYVLCSGSFNYLFLVAPNVMWG